MSEQSVYSVNRKKFCIDQLANSNVFMSLRFIFEYDNYMCVCVCVCILKFGSIHVEIMALFEM